LVLDSGSLLLCSRVLGKVYAPLSRVESRVFPLRFQTLLTRWNVVAVRPSLFLARQDLVESSRCECFQGGDMRCQIFDCVLDFSGGPLCLVTPRGDVLELGVVLDLFNLDLLDLLQEGVNLLFNSRHAVG
jgi:hypothetical protein